MCVFQWFFFCFSMSEPKIFVYENLLEMGIDGKSFSQADMDSIMELYSFPIISKENKYGRKKRFLPFLTYDIHLLLCVQGIVFPIVIHKHILILEYILSQKPTNFLNRSLKISDDNQLLYVICDQIYLSVKA